MGRSLFSNLLSVPKTGRTDPMLDLSGDRELLKALNELAARAGKMTPVNRVLRAAIAKGARIYTKEAKQQVKAAGAYQSGTLYKSLGHRMYMTLHGEVGAVIGPRTGFARRVAIVSSKRGKSRFKASKRKGTGKAMAAAGVEKSELRNPTRYAHLVERGTKHVPARPFLRRAFDVKVGYVKDIVWAATITGIQREAKKLAAKSAARRGRTI